MDQRKNQLGVLQVHRDHRWALVAVISCVSIYGITISLFTPLLSLILESRGMSSTLIGSLAMMTPLGVIVGSFFVPHYLQIFSGSRLLLAGIGFEIFLIILLLAMSDLASWFVIRFFMGVTGSVLFVVSDSWVAEIAPDAIRGRVMGLYNMVLLLSFALGPLILTVTGTSGVLPFVWGILLMVLAALPLSFTDRYVPESPDNKSFNVFSFIQIAPLLVFGCIAVAFKEMLATSLLPVYGVRSGLTESLATLMLFFGAIGGAALQIPIGWMADHYNRLWIMSSCGVFAVLGAAVLPFVVTIPWLLYVVVFLWTGFLSGIYTVVMTLAGQWFRGLELATAMAAFGVFWGLGGMAGPLIGGIAMDLWNPHGLPAVLLVMAVVFVVASFWRRWHHPAR
jgi:MFS family permease